VSIDGNIGYEGFVFISGWSYRVGGVGDCDDMVDLFLDMVGMARFSSSLSSSSSLVSSLVVPLMLILVSCLLATIVREVSYLSTIVTYCFSLACLFYMG